MASSKPDWMTYVKFETPILFRAIWQDRSLLDPYHGIYLFSVGAGKLTPASRHAGRPDEEKMQDGDVLYVGITQNADGFRGRFGDEYLRKDPTAATGKMPRRAVLMLQGWMLDPVIGSRLYVRFAPLEGDRRLLEDLETAILQFYGAPLNQSKQNSMTPFDDM